MRIGSESERDIIRPKHQRAVPGLGVFIAPNAVARLFQLHDYTKCPPFGIPKETNKHVLYPLLLPNVMHSPRYYHLRQAARFKYQKRSPPKKGDVFKATRFFRRGFQRKGSHTKTPPPPNT